MLFGVGVEGKVMADRDNEKVQSQNLELRTAINNAYAAVEGNKSVQSATAVTYEELIDQQIARIAGPSTTTRPNALDRVDRVLTAITSAVQQIKSMPDDAFREHDGQTDVNTSPSGAR